MKLLYRTRRKLFVTLLACALPCAVHAQESKQSDAKTQAQKDAKQEPRKDTKQGARKKSDEGAARRRREVLEAVAALKETAEVARSFDDVYESVRTQSEAADALWSYDEPTARAILKRAWETANAPGAEDHVQGFGTSEDPHEDALNALTTARGFIIKAALKHDARMGDAFMREFERGINDRSAAASATTRKSRPPIVVQQDESPDPSATQRRERVLSPAGWQRIFIARQLIEDGDFKHAAETVAPLINEGATLPLLKFILYLRARDARAADALYLRLLEATRADASADANDVLLLSTPFVSPGLCVSVNPDGSANFITLNYENDEARRAASSLSAEARLTFFNVAASVLLRPRAARDGKAPGDEDDSAALYFAIGRLLPFFEREAAQLAPALHVRLGSLNAEIEASRREALAAKMDVNSLTPKNPSDPLALTLEEVARAGDAKGRDFARLVVVAEAARLGLWDRARIVTEEIEDGEARRAARLIVAMRQVALTARGFEDDDEPDAFERAVTFIGAADVPPEVRAFGLAQAAELAARHGRRERADELLSQATGYAAEVAGNEQRATTLALITLSASRAGGVRVWELLSAFVRAADEADELRFGGMLLEFTVGMPDRKLWITVPDRPVGLEEVFASVARLDAVRTLSGARSFKDEELKAAALLAAARATLEKSKSAHTVPSR